MAVDDWAADQRRLSNLESFRHFTEVWPEPKRPRRVRGARKKLPADETLAELEWLLDNGARPWEAASALGRTQAGLSKMAYKYGNKRVGTIMLPERAAA